MDWRKPEIYRGPEARWLWYLKTVAVNPQMLMPLVYVSINCTIVRELQRTILAFLQLTTDIMFENKI